MLVLSRKSGEKIVIGNDITMTVVSVQGNRVKLAFEGPSNVRISRAELVAKLLAAQIEETIDPDLANKPAEWEMPAPDFVATL